MRLKVIAALAALTLFGGDLGAEACGGRDGACTPSVVVWPVYTETARRIGSVEAPVQRLPRLEVSRFTNQPLSVIYANPGSLPGSTDAYMRLVPLPHVRRSSTIDAYPVGY